ncbi:hypothetical protein X801_02774, partial [Opisthorchis viverrini]
LPNPPRSNWLNVGNADPQLQAASCKEIIDLPLVSAYNQAFLETITEEGSEFEPSEDGSFSWGNHADSYQVEILSNDSVHKNQGLGLDQQMIGDLECPVDYIDVSDICLSLRGPLGSDRIAGSRDIEQSSTDLCEVDRKTPHPQEQNSKPSYCETLGTDSASDQLDRRSFYDYGCDDEDEDVEDDEDLFGPPGVNERPATRKSHPINPSNHSALQDRTHLYNMPYETASSILDDIMKLDMDGSRYVWSDTCQSPHSTKQDHTFSKSNNHVLGRDIFEPWDLPYIDSDAFAGEPWAATYGSALETFLQRPKKASLDEITLTSIERFV